MFFLLFGHYNYIIVWYKSTENISYKKIKFINRLFFYITLMCIFAHEQILITMKTIKNFLKTCTAKLDAYNIEECVSILTDDQGGEVARVDHINSKITCEPSIWIGENKRTLTEKEIDYIIEFLFDETEDQKKDWEVNYDYHYDIRDEQGLYGYGY